MLVALSAVLSWFGTIVSHILTLKIPDGNGGYINYRSIILFLFLTKLSFVVIKMFLTKEHLELNEYESQSRHDRVKWNRKVNSAVNKAYGK